MTCITFLRGLGNDPIKIDPVLDDLNSFQDERFNCDYSISRLSLKLVFKTHVLVVSVACHVKNEKKDRVSGFILNHHILRAPGNSLALIIIRQQKR